ncbi:MAG TPA: carboxypeptidase-like regulatory domain-containing protein, partial [Terriglobales bacterium]|nr:carboxypeptidase-like regulatory domain-containing protein [Terriglobales bacterium]
MRCLLTFTVLISVFLVPWSAVYAQSRAVLLGRVVDPTGAAIAGVSIAVRNHATGLERIVQTDREGNYQVAALPVGAYRVEVRASGFQSQIVESLIVEVGLTVVQDFQLRVGDVSQVVTVTAASQGVERTTISVGHVVDPRAVQRIPLNGRHFLDLSLLTLGSVTPPQNGFSSPPMRGLGSLAINTAGNREETVNYSVNGITLNNLTYS